MARRIGKVVWELLATCSQVLQTVIFGLGYICHLTDVAPDRDETMSSHVGRSAVAGKKWALIAEKIINTLALWLGDKPNHCRRNIGT